MPNLAPFHQLFVFTHILGIFLFLVAHGVSVGVLFRLRGEPDPVVIRALLGLSGRSMGVMGAGFLIWFITGILAGFSGNFWTTGRYWIWASLAVALIVTILMTPWGRMYLDRVRQAVGIDPKTGEMSADAEPADPTAIALAVSSGRPMLLATVGTVGLVVLAWLMMFKPF